MKSTKIDFPEVFTVEKALNLKREKLENQLKEQKYESFAESMKESDLISIKISNKFKTKKSIINETCLTKNMKKLMIDNQALKNAINKDFTEVECPTFTNIYNENICKILPKPKFEINFKKLNFKVKADKPLVYTPPIARSIEEEVQLVKIYKGKFNTKIFSARKNYFFNKKTESGESLANLIRRSSISKERQSFLQIIQEK